MLTLSGCKNHTEISWRIPTEETNPETMTAEDTEQPVTPTEPTEEVETIQPENTAESSAETPGETGNAELPDDIEDWRRAYVEYLNAREFIGGGILLDDINFDGMPEAVIAVNPFGYTIVIYYNENGLQVLELKVTWGSVKYEPETGRISHTPFYGHTLGTFGYYECYVYEWNGSDYVQAFSELRESGYVLSAETAEYGQTYINGEPVSVEVYDEKTDEFFSQVGETDNFPVVKTSNENFEEYMRENFLGFNNWEIIEQPRSD